MTHRSILGFNETAIRNTFLGCYGTTGQFWLNGFIYTNDSLSRPGFINNDGSLGSLGFHPFRRTLIFSVLMLSPDTQSGFGFIGQPGTVHSSGLLFPPDALLSHGLISSIGTFSRFGFIAWSDS